MMPVRSGGRPIEEKKSFGAMIILAVAALTVGACPCCTEPVERQTPSDKTVNTDSASSGTPMLVAGEQNCGSPGLRAKSRAENWGAVS